MAGDNHDDKTQEEPQAQEDVFESPPISLTGRYQAASGRVACASS